MPNKMKALASKRKPAMSEEEIEASKAVAESDFAETDEEKKTISVQEIDPEKVKEIEKMIKRKEALRKIKEYNKKKYEETMDK